MAKKSLKLLLLISLAAFSTGGACPSTEQELLDDLKFALDNCRTATKDTDCNTAVEKGKELIALNNQNKEACILLSSAYFGRSGLDFLDILGEFTKIATSSDTNSRDFAQIRDALTTLGATVILSDLRLSVTTLTDCVTNASITTVTGNEDIFRQLGLMRALESMIRPVRLSGTNGGEIDANLGFNDATLASFERGVIVADFVNADDNLSETDVDDNDILRPIRENYCRCSLQDPLGGTPGFSAACYRDLMRCELNPLAVDETGDNGGIEQDYNRDGVTDDVDCITLLSPGTLSTCRGRNTTE